MIRARHLIPPLVFKLYERMCGIEPPLWAPLTDPVVKSYSQYNEDLVISSLCEHKNNGFYIDIGAHHPTFHNNTKRLYDKGWHGVNIEPNPELYDLFIFDRPRDLNLNIGIGSISGKKEFFEFSSSSLSSFDCKSALKKSRNTGKIIRSYDVQMLTLADLVKLHHIDECDFLSIDTEGLDFDVLLSNDWDTFRPQIIMIEYDSLNIHDLCDYLKSFDYSLAFRNHTNAIFISDLEKW